jgi:hypothetical protein
MRSSRIKFLECKGLDFDSVTANSYNSEEVMT